jgi:hypothetical protein
MLVEENMLKYGNLLAQGDIKFKGIPVLLVTEGKETYRLDCNVDSGKDSGKTELCSADIIDYSGNSDLLKAVLVGSDYNAMIICKPEWIGRAIDENVVLYPTLEDMAMIVGPKVLVVRKDRREIEKAIKNSSAVMLENESVLCFGRNVFEAYTCLTVLEKNAKIYYKAKKLGGAKYVKKSIATLEHRIYLQKYSQAERRNQNATEGRE